MKCNVCGSEIDGIVGLCPYCFSNLYTDAEQLEKEKISFLMESCPDLSKEYKGKLLDVDIIFDRDYSQIINANLFLSSMFECDQERFAQKIMEFKSVDTYVDDVIKVAKEIISDSAYMITALLQKNEIEISRKDVYTLCSQSIDIYMSGIDSIINSGDETRDKKNNDLTKKFQNEMANPEYIKFMGIGYGMKGAMDASIQSSLLNAGSRLVSDTASIATYTLGVAFNNISLNLKKKELIKSEDFINYVIKLFKVSEGEIACKINRKINENLFVKLFGKNSVEKNRIKQIKKMKIDKKEKTHRIIEVLKDSPFYLEGYQELYSVLEETRGSEILKYVNDLIYKSNIETMLMSLDAAQISRCAYAANDSYNQALEKLKTLHNISQQGSAYNNYLFSEDPNAKMLKDYLIRNWKRCVSENNTNLSIYFKDVHMLEEDWNRADGSILYATALFQKYLTLYEACKTASDIEKFEEIVQKNLDNCKNKSTSAKCIWADMGMRISIWTKKDYTKFWDMRSICMLGKVRREQEEKERLEKAQREQEEKERLEKAQREQEEKAHLEKVRREQEEKERLGKIQKTQEENNHLEKAIKEQMEREYEKKMKKNPLGIVSLICAVIGIPTTIIIVGIIPDLIGFITGIIALSKKNKKKKAAFVGTGLSVLGIVLFIYLVVTLGL